MAFACYTTSSSQPLKLELRLENCTEKYLYISFNNSGIISLDTIRRLENGSYYLRTSKIHEPQITDIYSNGPRLRELYLAPGYDLVITGNGIDNYALSKSVSFSGYGSRANTYTQILGSILRNIRNPVTPYEKNENVFLTGLTQLTVEKNALVESIFYKEVQNDSSLAFFGKIKKIDNRFDQIGLMMSFAKNLNKDPLYRTHLLETYAKINKSELLDESLLISSSFRDFISTAYLEYLDDLDTKSEEVVANSNFRLIDRAQLIYSGKIRQYVIKRLFENFILLLNNREELQAHEEGFLAQLNLLESDSDKKEIVDFFAKRKIEFDSLLVGKASPIFVGTDIDGKKHNINEFLSKVIYIDLWATWCIPCREQNPYLKNLYQQYKTDSNIAIISIAVADYIIQWKNVLKTEKPQWINWFDMDGDIRSIFGGVLPLPKFIIIDKQGKLVDFAAPPPSDFYQVKKKLDEILSK